MSFHFSTMILQLIALLMYLAVLGLIIFLVVYFFKLLKQMATSLEAIEKRLNELSQAMKKEQEHKPLNALSNPPE